MQEVKTLEKVIKSKNESLKLHSINIQDENEQLRKENDMLVKYLLEDWLLSLMSTLVMGFGPQD
jgi:hypothetical protein